MVASFHSHHSARTEVMTCSSPELEQLSPRCVGDEIGLPSTKPTAPHKAPRNVSFLVDELDRDLVEVIEIEKAPLCCLPDLYWSDDEKNEFMENARSHVVDFESRNLQRIQRLETVFFNCTQRDISHQEHKEDMRILLKWVKSSGRGLEDSMSRMFYENRNGYIQDMLEYFAYLADTFVPGTDVDDELRRFSECRTRRCREFAFKLAMADELTQ
jgi:hypothetical protein